MNRRLELHKILVKTLGSNNVYFQPPASLQLKYPCVIYSRTGDSPKHANNKLYLQKKKYQIIVVDKNPDSAIPERISELPLCRYERHYNSDNLNHDVYLMYY